MTDYIRIQQIRSPIRRHYSQRFTLKSLGLNKIGRTVAVRFNGPMWGMIQKVRHLIRFPDQQLFEEHRLVLPQPEDEEADRALMLQLLFKGHDVEAVRLPEGKKKSPDFKVTKNGELKGYCELKSPRDDWIFAVPRDLKAGEIREESRGDPTAHALARVIGKAAAQFDAVNPDHAQPNILVIVSHARLRGRLTCTWRSGACRCPMAAAGFCWSIRTRRISGRLSKNSKSSGTTRGRSISFTGLMPTPRGSATSSTRTG